MKYFLFLFVCILSISCSTNEIDYSSQNEAEILEYIEKNNLNAVRTDSGLYYAITEEGTGIKPKTNSSVTVNYGGYFTDGELFDQGKNVTFNLQQVIPGWTEGLTYFKEGTLGWLLIPSRLGYGNSGSGNIPGGAVLVFNIRLLNVN